MNAVDRVAWVRRVCLAFCGCSLLALGGVACQNTGGTAGSTKTSDAASDVGAIGDRSAADTGATDAPPADATPTDTTPTDTTPTDTGPSTCDPACEPWQTCALAAGAGPSCAEKACSTGADCNTPGGPTAAAPEHWCLQGTCVAWQCASDTDCAKGSKCNTKTYRCYVVQTGCAYDGQCVDDKICTDDTCDKTTGKCAHKPVKGCCESDIDCDDGVACTTDACTKGTCESFSKKGCCTSDAQCADSSACTQDTCEAGACVFTPIKGCCQGSGACDDSLDATDDSCIANLCVHKLAGMTATCTTTATCAGTACATGSCVAGQCSWSKTPAGTGCCVSDAQCATDEACFADACTGFVCASTAVKGVGVHIWQRFEDAGLPGWTVTKGNSVAGFQSSALLAYDGKRALRYGVPGKKTWSAGFPNKGTARSPAITVPKTSASLRFQLFFDGEPSTGVHQFGVRIVDSAGKSADVWTKNTDLKGNTAGKWVQVDVALAKWAGQTVRVEFWFDVAVNYPKEDGFGLVIDELRVLGGCPS